MADTKQQERESEITRLKSHVEQLSAQLAEAELRLREMGIADPITGLYSYRYFLGRITEEVSRADRFNLDVSCLLLSLDKPGFEALLEIAKLLKDCCRQYDIPARWGQNELVMLLPATDLDGAQTFAERFRLNIEETYRRHPGLEGLTVSIGLATYPRPGIEDAQQLLECADGALHFAMQSGGNRTIVRE
ncbi:MAG TPA: GGDEF domain-containing protein [Oscillatoriaceae cyanobacterium]